MTTTPIETIAEPSIKILTSADIKEKFSQSDFLRIVKQCDFKTFNSFKQHDSIWLKDSSGEFHVVIKDRAYKNCTYLGAYEGAKFDVVLENKFFDTLKSYFQEKADEKNNTPNQFSSASNTSVSTLQKV
jgi:hypothetical protein